MANVPDFIPDEQMQALSGSSLNNQAPLAGAASPTAAQSGGQSAPDFIPDDQFVADDEKYSTPDQQIKAGLEGAAKGLIGNTAATAAETKLLGVKPEDIEGREQANPYTSGLSQAAGFTAGALTGTGEAAVLGKIGEAGAGLFGVTKAVKAAEAAGELAPLSSRIGSEAIKQATEMAVMGGDDALAKKLFYNPQESAEQALGEITLSAALGGAGGAFVTGAVSPLWKATVGPNVEGFLSSLSSKLGGNAGETAAKSTAKDLFDKANIDPNIAPSAIAKINGEPTADSLFSTLSSSDTKLGGQKVAKEMADLNEAVTGRMANIFGHDADSVEALDTKLDKYNTGRDIADTLHTELTNTIKPISDAYDKTNEMFKTAPVSEEAKKLVADKMAQKAIDGGWMKSDSDAQINLLQRVQDKLPYQETAADLKQFITNLRENHPFGSPTYAAARDISNILKEAQEQSVMESIAAKGGGAEEGQAAVEEYKGLKGQYSKLMDTLDGLNEHLHVGKYYGPKSFLQNLKEMGAANGEGVLSRLNGANKADTLSVLQQFPDTLQKIKQYHSDQLVAGSRNSLGKLDATKLTRKFDALSPQIKDLVADKGAQDRLQALGQINERTKVPSSGLAKSVEKLTHGTPSALSLMAAMLGHAGAGIGAYLGNIGIKEGSDAGRYAMLKFLGSEKPINAAGFKAAVDFMSKTIKGESALNRAVKGVFQSGAAQISSAVNQKDLDKLDKQVTAAQQDQNSSITEKLANGDLAHYMPDHQVAMATSTIKALNYLQSIKPQETKATPLDRPVPVTKAQQARYERALTIAQNPHTVLEHLKQGTLQASDIQDLNAMYPSVYAQMQSKLMTEVASRHADSEPIPYKTRLSMGLFMQHPMDATMTPQAIMAAQPKLPAQPQGQGAPRAKHSTAKLGKSNPTYQTASQSAESDRTNRS